MVSKSKTLQFVTEYWNVILKLDINVYYFINVFLTHVHDIYTLYVYQVYLIYFILN
jgi:hypothetical protein